MEKAIYSEFSLEERILDRMKKEGRSSYWLAAQIRRSQTYVYTRLCGPVDRKMPLTKDFLAKISEVWPDLDLNQAKSNEDSLQDN